MDNWAVKTASEIKKLAKLYPEFSIQIGKLLCAARTQGMKVSLWSGLRTFEEQQKLFDKRNGSTLARAGFSWHNYGLAADIVFIDDKGRPSWGAKWPWAKLGELGEGVGLEWGGRFKTIKDLGHFQWDTKHGLKLAEMCRAHKAGGVSAAWKLLRETEGGKHGSGDNESMSGTTDVGNVGDISVGNGSRRDRRRDKRRIRAEQGELA